jgi:hypothetical protein
MMSHPAENMHLHLLEKIKYYRSKASACDFKVPQPVTVAEENICCSSP